MEAVAPVDPRRDRQPLQAMIEVRIFMQSAHPTDLELAALISSKICHDVVGPVGAIYNGIETLDDGGDEETKVYAMTVIRNVTKQASAKLQFARFAFGAAGSAGALIDLGTAEQISRGFIETGKHKLAWSGTQGYMAKDRVKLLLNLVANGPSALPRGGEITVSLLGTAEAPEFLIRCRGQGVRPPQDLTEIIVGDGITSTPVNVLTIQPYYTWRLAQATGMRLEILKDGDDILLSAKPG